MHRNELRKKRGVRRRLSTRRNALYERRCLWITIVGAVGRLLFCYEPGIDRESVVEMFSAGLGAGHLGGEIAALQCAA